MNCSYLICTDRKPNFKALGVDEGPRRGGGACVPLLRTRKLEGTHIVIQKQNQGVKDDSSFLCFKGEKTLAEGDSRMKTIIAGDKVSFF